jgi:hypothetical protein
MKGEIGKLFIKSLCVGRRENKQISTSFCHNGTECNQIKRDIALVLEKSDIKVTANKSVNLILRTIARYVAWWEQ